MNGAEGTDHGASQPHVLRVVRRWPAGTVPLSWKVTFTREFDRAAFLATPVSNLLVGTMVVRRPSW